MSCTLSSAQAALCAAFVKPERLVIHPLVFLSVLDHFNRTNSSNAQSRRVVGALLGHWSGRTVHVTNSFAVPFSEDPNDPLVWFLDADYMVGMRDLYKKVSANERLVGWYHTGPGVFASDTVIHQVLREHVEGEALMVVFDAPNGRFDGYCMISSSGTGGSYNRVNGSVGGTHQLVHLQGAIAAEEAEEVGVEHLLRDVTDTAAGSLSLGLSNQLQSLQRMREGLEEIIEYLNGVLAGELAPNQRILGDLQRIIMNRHNCEGVERLSEASTDQAMLIYVGHLTRSILSLHALIENKAKLQEKENLSN